MKKINSVVIIFILSLVAIGAKAQAAFPTVTVNLNYPQYQRLKIDGGFVYIEAGAKGIILYRQSENQYIAYERACPHDPFNSAVQVDGSTLFMIDRTCKSTFSFPDGQPTGGPAQRALIQYQVEQSESVLKITDEIIN